MTTDVERLEEWLETARFGELVAAVDDRAPPEARLLRALAIVALEGLATGRGALEALAHEARTAGDPATTAMVGCAVALHELEAGRNANAATTSLEAQTLALAHGLGLAHLAPALAVVEAWLAVDDQQPDAPALARRALGLATSAGDARSAVRAGLLLARSRIAERLVPDLAEPLRWTQVLRDRGHHRTLVRMGVLWRRVYADQGQPARASAELARVRAWALQRGDVFLLECAPEAATREPDPRVEELVRVGVELGRTEELEPLLQGITRAALDLLDADRAFTLLKDPSTGQVAVRTALARDGAPGTPSLSVVHRAMRLGREVITSDAAASEDLAAAKSVMALGIRTVLCVPLQDRDQVQGALYADSARATPEVLAGAAWLARALGALASVAVVRARAVERDRDRLERARELNHDVRNLVFGLLSALEELREDQGSDTLLDDIERTVQQVYKHTTRAIEERGSARRAVDLTALAGEVSLLLSVEARRRGCRIVVRGPPVRVSVDPDDFGRAITNLVSNALKYSPKGGTVRVDTASQGAVAMLTVDDDGPGIPEPDLPRIFESGFQALGAAPGHGLGLAVVKRVVAAAGGSVRAENRPGGGARFVVRLAGVDPVTGRSGTR